MLRATFATLRSAAVASAIAIAPAVVEGQDWSGQVTLYGWGAGVAGDFSPVAGAPSASFDRSLSEVLEDLDAAFFMTALARRGDLVLLGDFSYSSSSREGALQPGIPASGEVTMRTLTLAAGRRWDAGSGSTIDLLGGIRAWSLDGLVSVPLAGVSLAPEKTFFDPIVAVRTVMPLSDRWSALGYVDAGGFGIGSDLTWQAVASANFRATERLNLSLGWRRLYVDYSDSGTEFEGSMSGPMVGATWQF